MTFMAYFGHLNLDVTISVENIATRGSAAATGLSRQFGGTLGNFSFVSSSLGLDFHPYTAVSPSSHEKFLDTLEKRGVDISRITLDENSEGPVCYIISDRKDQNAYMFQGPMDTWKPDSFFTGDNYRYIHFSSGPPEPYIAISERSKAKRVFDPSQELFYKYSPDQIRRFVENCDIVMGNRQEVESILKTVGSDIDSGSNAFDIVMTDGVKGTVAVIGGKKQKIKSPHQDHVFDTIGAGDAFRAGFYSALYRNMEITGAIAVGNITASLAIAGPIPEFSYSWEDVSSIYREQAEKLID